MSQVYNQRSAGISIQVPRTINDSNTLSRESEENVFLLNEGKKNNFKLNV